MDHFEKSRILDNPNIQIRLRNGKINHNVNGTLNISKYFYKILSKAIVTKL
jgi:hypothetical protein